MLDNILNAANRYADGLSLVQQRRDNWLKKYTELKDRLIIIAGHLNTHTTYPQGFFVDILHAYDQQINGACANMPSVTFRSGSMPMLVTFRNSMGEKKSYQEQGFHITFTPTITGQVIVFLTPHHSELDKRPQQYATLAVLDDPGQLTDDITDDIIAKGIQAAFITSFTAINDNNENTTQGTPTIHNPIGFKLHDTTEKIK